MRLLTVLFSILTLTVLAVPGFAEDCDSPCIDYTGDFDVTGWWVDPGEADASNYSIVDPTGELDLAARLGSGFAIVSNIVAEPVLDVEPGSSRAFGDVGLYLDVLQAEYDFEDFSIWGGKSHPTFGRAYDVALGLRGTDIGENYELQERIGAGASYSFEAGGFSNTIQSSLFTTDRTVLSESLFTNRGRTSLSDGGAGNTSGLSSVVVSIGGCLGAEIESCFDDGELGYQLAALYQRGGEGSDVDEFGLEGDFNKTFPMSEDVSLKLFGELAWFKNYEATEDDAVFLTGTAAVVTGDWTTSFTLAGEDRLAANGEDTKTYIADTEILYDFGEDVSVAGEDWTVGVGYTFTREDGVDSHYIGLKIATSIDGSLPLHR